MSVHRIVSLVPSLTEALADMGLLESLVGRTRYCVEPVGDIESVGVVGGTKNPNIEAIMALEPDLVVMNAEENRLEDYQALASAALNVHVTHPRTVAEAAAMLGELGCVAGAEAQGRRLERACMDALAEVVEAVSRRSRVSVFCPIWRNPWMTFHNATYVGDVLRSAGFRNVYADAGAEDGDFFAVRLEDAAARQPDLVLLPDEPYVFAAEHARELAEQGVGKAHELLDGKDLSWYGPRLPGALRRLAALAA